MITTKDLLPGDLISLAFKKRSNYITQTTAIVDKKKVDQKNNQKNNGNDGDDGKEDEKEEEVEDSRSNLTSRDELVPCDCLLLRGAAVVNEASLTGKEHSLLCLL